MAEASSAEARAPIPRLPSAERKRQIIQACVDVIAEKSFSSTSTREIARRAGVSLGTLIHHFGGKDQILAASMDYIVETWAQGAVTIVTGPGAPVERLDRLIEWTLGDPECDRLWRVYMAFWHEAVFHPDMRSSILEGNLVWDRAVASCIQEAIDAGELAGDPDHVGKVLSTLMNGVAIHIHGRLGRWDRRTGIELCREYVHSHRS
jgi:AcrR family transcriptional regulator